MKRIIALVMAVTIATLLVANPPAEQRMRRSGMHNNPERSDSSCASCSNKNRDTNKQCDNMFEKLELTEEQQEKVNKLHFDHRLALIDFRAELQKLSFTKQKHIADADFRNAKRVTDQFHAKKAEMEKKKIEMRENIYQLLTNEQKEAFKDTFPRRKHHRNRP